MAKITKGRGTFLPKRLRIAPTRWMPSQSFLSRRHDQLMASVAETLAWAEEVQEWAAESQAKLEAQLNPPPEPSRSWFFGIIT